MEKKFFPGVTFLDMGIILLLSSVLYLNAILNGFVIDDIHQVVDNPWIRNIKFIPEIFSSGVWEFEGRVSSYYRPFTYILYMATYHFFGLKPWGYHLVNVLFHTGGSVVVFLLASSLFKKSQSPESTSTYWPPFLVALLFAAHPIHTEAVVWVAGVMDVSFTFFYLLSFYLYIRSSGDGFSSKGGYFLSVFFFFLATLCKEPALTLPLVLIVYDGIFRRGGGNLGFYVKRYMPYFAVAGIYMVMRVNALGGFAPVKTEMGLTTYQYMINTLVLYSQFLEKLVLPVNLNIWHIFHPITSLFTLRGVLALFVSVVFVGFTFLMAKKNKVVFFGLLMIVIPLLPGLYIPALTQGLENAFTERYLYLPSFGFVLVLGAIGRWIWAKMSGKRSIIIVFICVVIGLYSAGTVRRNPIWKDSYTLWSDAVKKSPGSAIPHQNLGYALLYQGRNQEAKEHLEMALKIKPDLINSLIARGMTYTQKGLLDKAILQFHTVLIFKPDSVETHYNLGLAYDNKGWTKQAMEHYLMVLNLKPDHVDANNNVGIIYGTRGLIDKAIEHFEIALTCNPTDSHTLHNLANAYRLKGLSDKAMEYKRRAESFGR